MPTDKTVQLIDIGVNLTDTAFSKDRDEVIKAARECGVSSMIVTGTTLEESEQAVELCQQQPDILRCTAGVHPHYSSTFDTTTRLQLWALAQEDTVVAIGETGLDFNRNFSTPEQQTHAFEQQLELACETGLPLFLHERDAHQKQLEMLSSCRDHFSRAVAHCFTGSRKELYNYLDLDLYIGITGWICDERRGTELQKLIKEIPADRLLLETDAPYLIPRDMRPKPKSRRNLPQYLPHILNKAARLTDKEDQQLAQEVFRNSCNFFNL